MIRCASRSALALSFVFVVAFPHGAAGQRLTGGLAKGTASTKAIAPNDFYNLVFPATPVGATDTETCYYNCFYISNPNTCDGSGMISLTKSLSAPFSVTNLRIGTFNGGCGGTPATLPVTLGPNELLLQDFVFSPTAEGTFADTYVYDMNGGPFTWNLSGSTPGPVIVSFAATPSTVRPGQLVTLSWVTQNATSVSIDNGVGTEPPSGTATVTPSANTTYTLTSMNGMGSMTATVTVTVLTDPQVVVSEFADPMFQLPSSGGAMAQFTLTNAGGTSTSVTLTQNGTFFSQNPTSFTLAPGASQVVTITGIAQPPGAFEGASSPSGAGVPAGLQIPIKLLSWTPPTAPVQASATTNRVDVAGAAGASPSGSVSFTNNGNAVLNGLLTSDAPWIIPQSGVVSIQPNSTATFPFSIDRTQRADAGALLGSESGEISLTYLASPASKGVPLDVAPVPSVSTVSVVDTVQLTVSTGTAPPPLATGEVALFVPGVGHVVGSVGTFLSDLSILNPPGNPSISDIRFFYTPTTAGSPPQSTALPPVGGVSVALADVVKNVFGSSAQVGSLQIRSASAAQLSVNTNIFNASNPAGTYGTTIPTFRSDRAVGAGGQLVLTGLRQDATGHTNLFIQETSGLGITVQTQFFDVNGTTLGTRSDTVGAFALDQINNQVPPGAVVAVMTNMSSGSATFLAYATPVDQASGDNWAIVDWSRQDGYSQGDPVIVPVAGVLQGANNTFFRTDVAITNTGSASASGTLRFYPRGGSLSDRTITLGALQTDLETNVIGSLFGAPSGSVGYLLFTPAGGGTFAITSRTYTTVAGSVATFGTHVPTLPLAGSMTVGALRAIGSLQDAALPTVVAARPATFRTNFGLVETSGNSVTVRVTLRFTFSGGSKVQGIGSASKDYTLGPNEFRQINGIAADIIGTGRDTLGDLRDLEADFQVISGSGAVAVYTSSTDNGTGDVILRTE